MTEEEILNLPYRPCVGIMLCNAQGGIFAGQRLIAHKMHGKCRKAV